MTNITVPAGTYFLGDPCYAVPDEHWLPLLEASDFFKDEDHGEVAGHTVYAFGTGGDGCFEDQDGHEYPVDSGLIGLTPLLLTRQSEIEALKRSGQFVTFAEPV